MRHKYDANPNQPGGFKELSVVKGVCCHVSTYTHETYSTCTCTHTSCHAHVLHARTHYTNTHQYTQASTLSLLCVPIMNMSLHLATVWHISIYVVHMLFILTTSTPSLVQVGTSGCYNSVGQEVVLINEHPSNEHWWEVRNEDGMTGFVPASYVMVRETPSASLPWLGQQVLQQAEEERKERAVRLSQVKLVSGGKGFGPAPREEPLNNQTKSGGKARSTSGKVNYCDICKREFNGPIPYKVHLASKGHREEAEAQESYSNS